MRFTNALRGNPQTPQIIGREHINTTQSPSVTPATTVLSDSPLLCVPPCTSPSTSSLIAVRPSLASFRYPNALLGDYLKALVRYAAAATHQFGAIPLVGRVLDIARLVSCAAILVHVRN